MNRNYQKELDQLLERLQQEAKSLRIASAQLLRTMQFLCNRISFCIFSCDGFLLQSEYLSRCRI